MQKGTMHFLKMSGYVPISKHKEFEQTFRFISNQLSTDCLQYNLSIDIFDINIYHFYSLWSSEESEHKFLQSPEFQILQGAFQTLGSLGQKSSGKLVDVKLFEQDAND